MSRNSNQKVSKENVKKNQIDAPTISIENNFAKKSQNIEIPKVALERIIDNDKDDIKLLMKGEKGQAELYCFSRLGRIKITDANGNGYRLHPEKILWEKVSYNYFIGDISSFLIDTITDLIKHNKESIDVMKQLTTTLLQCYKARHSECVFKFVKSDMTLYDPTFITKLNVGNPRLLPISNNKILNLDTLKCRNRTREDLYTFECPVTLLPLNHPLDNAKKFMSDITNNNIEIMNHIQEVLGYSFTGEMDQRCFWILWGEGSNGKSVLIEIIKIILNQYFVTVSEEVFLAGKKKNSGACPELIALIGARFGCMSEPEKDEKLKERTIKNITGMDSISCRQLYGEQIEFRPICKLFMLTNHKIGADVGNKNKALIQDRLKYIPFLSRFTKKPKGNEKQADPKFVQDLHP